MKKKPYTIVHCSFKKFSFTLQWWIWTLIETAIDQNCVKDWNRLYKSVFKKKQTIYQYRVTGTQDAVTNQV